MELEIARILLMALIPLGIGACPSWSYGKKEECLLTWLGGCIQWAIIFALLYAIIFLVSLLYVELYVVACIAEEATRLSLRGAVAGCALLGLLACAQRRCAYDQN